MATEPLICEPRFLATRSNPCQALMHSAQHPRKRSDKKGRRATQRVYAAVDLLLRPSWRDPLRRTGWVLTALGLAFALVAADGHAASALTRLRPSSSRPQRVLVLSLPATTWADLDTVP